MPSNGSDPRQLMTSVFERVFFRAEPVEQAGFCWLRAKTHWRHDVLGWEMDWHQLDLNPRLIAGVRRGEDSLLTFIFIPVSQSVLTPEMFYIPLNFSLYNLRERCLFIDVRFSPRIKPSSSWSCGADFSRASPDCTCCFIAFLHF